MDRRDRYEEFCALLGSNLVRRNVPLSTLTTFGIGGPADLLIEPQSTAQVKAAAAFCRENGLTWYVLGRGSNVLAADEGFRGVIIALGNGLSEIEIEGTVVRAQAGARLSAVARKALESGLGGAEFLAGIPGSVGGAVNINAGAYGGEIKDILLRCTVLDRAGEVRNVDSAELGLSYRHSRVPSEGWIVLEAELNLIPRERGEIQARMEELSRRRMEKQPLNLPSAGSTFKRPEGNYAAALIEQSGLKGYAVGGACVSEKHAGFVVNTGGATARDVAELIEYIRDTVRKKTGVALEPEVVYLGFDEGGTIG